MSQLSSVHLLNIMDVFVSDEGDEQHETGSMELSMRYSSESSLLASYNMLLRDLALNFASYFALQDQANVDCCGAKQLCLQEEGS